MSPRATELAERRAALKKKRLQRKQALRDVEVILSALSRLLIFIARG